MKKLLLVLIMLSLGWKLHAQVHSALGSGLRFAPVALLAEGDSVWALEQAGDSMLTVHVWNGSFWFTLPDLEPNIPLQGKVLMCRFNGEIFVTGNFDKVNDIDNSARIVRWDGSSWKSLAAGLRVGQLNQINDIQVYKNELYIAGRIQVVDNKDMKNIARWNGQVWNYANLGTDGEIYDLDTCDRKLWAVGEFQNTGGSYNPYLSCFNGWYWYSHPAFAVDKPQQPITKLTRFRDKMMIYGDFRALDSSLSSESMLLLDDNSWQPSQQNLLNPEQGFNWWTINDNTYLTGNILTIDSVEHYVFQFDGTSWVPVPEWDHPGVERLVQGIGGLVGAGQFTGIDGINQGHIVLECKNCSKITGTVYRDFNNNCIKDSADIPYNRPWVRLNPGNLIYHLDDSGRYVMDVEAGSYTMELVGQPWYQPCAPITLNAVSGQIHEHDFGTTVQTGSVDIATHISSYAGNSAELYRDEVYTITTENMGAVNVGVQLKLKHDPRMGFQIASQSPVNYIPYEITWNILNIKPGEQHKITVIFNTSAYFNVGDEAKFMLEAVVTEPDQQLSNNIDSLNVKVVAFRPIIEKSVRPTENEHSSDIYPDTRKLRYTIRFQNNTDQTIKQVVLLDTFKINLMHVDSFKITGFSHPYKLETFGASGLRFIFKDINLPTAAISQNGSLGFMEFEVYLKGNLNLGQLITNTAFLYYDYRPAIATNRVETYVKERPAIGIIEKSTVKGTVLVYPNPTQGLLNIALPEDGNYHLEVFDIPGKQLFKQDIQVQNGLSSINLEGLPAGLYFMRLAGATVVQQVSFEIQH